MNIELTTNNLNEEFGYQIGVRVDTNTNPIEALKGLAMTLREQDPDHPLLKAKKYEFISLPRKNEWIAEVLEFVDSPRFQKDVIYISIFQLDYEIAVWKTIEEVADSKVKNYPHKGTRKWVTKYVVYQKDTKQELGQYDTKAEAVSFARAYTVNNACETYVRIEKRLADNSHLVADIQPIKRKKKVPETNRYNYYIYFGKASGQ